MNLKEYLKLDSGHLDRTELLCRKYKKMYEDPDNCEPMFIINTPVALPPWEERLADPMAMLRAELDQLRPHLELEDDRTPTVRVQFGTAQIAAAFGCEMFIPTNSLPAAGSHVLKNAEDVYKLRPPSLEDGWYGKLKKYTDVFLENLPKGVHIQLPDIQSAFNSAHLIRGNDILLDFYDDSEALEALLDMITDYMIELVPYLNGMINRENGWFFDWGALWKGAARISNCSMHMINPAMYLKHILPRDIRFMKAMGGGRIHYCGTNGQVIDEFFKNPEVTGLDYDLQYHDLWSLSDRAPKNLVLAAMQWGDRPEEMKSLVQRLLGGDWPKKRNIILQLEASSVAEGKELLKELRKSVKKSI